MSDDVGLYDRLAKTVKDLLDESVTVIADRRAKTSNAITDDSGKTRGMPNPMRVLGDLIRGGADGVGQRLAVGDEGQVLTVVSGVPDWADASGTGTSGRYREELYTTYAGGDLLYDTDGHLMYTLEDLE